MTASPANPRLVALRWIVAVLATALPTAVFATAEVAAAAPVAADDVLGMIFGLIAVVASVLAVGWLYSRSRGLSGGAGQVISVLAAQPLGPKERIVLVEVGGKQIVVGMTAAQLQTLHVFDEPVVSESAPPAVPAAFAERLRSMLKGHGR